MTIRLEVEIVGPPGPLNPAQVGFILDSGLSSMTDDQAVATVISYVAKAMSASSVAGEISRVRVASGVPGAWGPFADAACPTSELADWHAIDSDSPTATAFPIAVGSGSALASVGTSVNVAELTTIGGRHNGRHFLPWVKTSALDNSGLVHSTTINDVNDAAAWRLGGTIYTQPAWWDAGFTVATSSPTASTPITGWTTRRAPARLRSRIR